VEPEADLLERRDRTALADDLVSKVAGNAGTLFGLGEAGPARHLSLTVPGGWLPRRP